jgi:hypothetical protein
MWTLATLTLGMSLAHAQAVPPPSREEKVRITTESLDLYAFEAATCDGVRAEVKDDRPAEARSEQLVLELRSTAPGPCTWTGLVLKGWLDGIYEPLGDLPDDGHVELAPGAIARFRIKPRDPSLPRGGVQLQIPPGKGYLVFVGTAPPAPPPEAPPTPSASPDPSPPPGPRRGGS